ncbi:MAG TPA: hypothetical protein VGR00_03230, partial [Thermoanaerobaculia bacterium]|nr:hypothetical protein [Thermoanaerobaculia bacterium]
ADQSLVNVWFERYLHRAASMMDRSTFGSLLQMGTRDEEVLASIVGSTEYFQKLAGYAAAIDWGDGNTTAGTVAFTSGTTFTVSGSHLYAAACVRDAKATITDVGGSIAVSNVTVYLDTTMPGVSAPAASTTTQTLCQ